LVAINHWALRPGRQPRTEPRGLPSIVVPEYPSNRAWNVRFGRPDCAG
jgi:hypothetical protein